MHRDKNEATSDDRRNVYVPATLWERAKVQAVYESTKISRIVCRALRLYLERPPATCPHCAKLINHGPQNPNATTG